MLRGCESGIQALPGCNCADIDSQWLGPACLKPLDGAEIEPKSSILAKYGHIEW